MTNARTSRWEKNLNNSTAADAGKNFQPGYGKGEA